jgi:hypothetical protein
MPKGHSHHRLTSWARGSVEGCQPWAAPLLHGLATEKQAILWCRQWRPGPGTIPAHGSKAMARRVRGWMRQTCGLLGRLGLNSGEVVGWARERFGHGSAQSGPPS